MNEINYCQKRIIRAYFRDFFIMKILSFITGRFYFDFQNFFIVDGFAIKFFSHAIAEFIPNIILFFQ